MLYSAFNSYRQLKKSQWWSYDRLYELQMERLRAILKHSYANVPLYREKFDLAGVNPVDINDVSDLIKIPPVTKDELRPAFPNRWLADNYVASDCVETVTSGSTGAPLKFYLDKRSLAFRFALNMRTLEFSPYRLGQKLFQVSPPLSGKLKSGMRTRAIDLFLRRLTIPPFDTDVTDKLRQMLDFKPAAIVGYTSYIRSLADKAKELGLEVEIASIMTTSELLLDENRRRLTETFGGRVFDQYGSVETGRSAVQCEVGDGYHINMEGVVIEIIDEAGRLAKPGETGEVLVTNLSNFANPFIRYRIGDMAGASTNLKCPCGRELPMLSKVAGRINDIIVTPDKRKILPEYFYLTLREIKGLAQFQVVQTTASSLKVSYAKEIDFDEAKRQQVEAEYRDYLSEMNVVWEPVTKIAKISGKHKHIIALK